MKLMRDGVGDSHIYLHTTTTTYGNANTNANANANPNVAAPAACELVHAGVKNKDKAKPKATPKPKDNDEDKDKSKPKATANGKNGKRPRPPPKSGRERGQLFRLRQRALTEEKQRYVVALRDQIEQLQRSRILLGAQTLTRRHSDVGSLARVVREYLEAFGSGLGAEPPMLAARRSAQLLTPSAHEAEASPAAVAAAQRQAELLCRIMAPDARTGDLVGPWASLEQWRIYTAAHVYMHTTVVSVKVEGSEENPMVVVRSLIRTKWCRDTIRLLFPFALHDEALVHRFVGKEVVYQPIARYWFTPEGQIAVEEPNLNLVESLLAGGASVQDVGELMKHTTVSKGCTVTICLDADDEDGHAPSHETEATTGTSRMDLRFLLSDE